MKRMVRGWRHDHPIGCAPTAYCRAPWWSWVALVVVLCAAWYVWLPYRTLLSFGEEDVHLLVPGRGKGDDTVIAKEVRMTYRATAPRLGRLKRDARPQFSRGSYIELNGDGELTYNAKVVARDARIRDALLSKNGKHYAYRIELESAQIGGLSIARKSDVYIDGTKVATVTSATLAAVSDDGASYLVTRFDDTPHVTANGSPAFAESLVRSDESVIVSAPHGFSSVSASGDLATVLSRTKGDASGGAYYANDRKLEYCSFEWSGSQGGAPNAQAVLARDGASVGCVVYYLTGSRSGTGSSYGIAKYRIYLNDEMVASRSAYIDASGISFISFNTPHDWAVGFGKTVEQSRGAAVALSDILPQADTALQEPDCKDHQSLVDMRVSRPSRESYALLMPCSHVKLFLRNVPVESVPNLSDIDVRGIEYEPDDKTLYIYEL